jgi:hypothetical protein
VKGVLGENIHISMLLCIVCVVFSEKEGVGLKIFLDFLKSSVCKGHLIELIKVISRPLDLAKGHVAGPSPSVRPLLFSQDSSNGPHPLKSVLFLQSVLISQDSSNGPHPLKSVEPTSKGASTSMQEKKSWYCT